MRYQAIGCCLALAGVLLPVPGATAQEKAQEKAGEKTQQKTGAGANKAPDARAQAAARLEQLLKELGAMDPATWQARIDALEAEAKTFDGRAAGLRQQATAATRRAAATRARIERLRKMMAVLAPRDPSGKAATAAGKPAAKAPAAKAPAAKAPAAKAPAAKAPATKAPAAKASAAKASAAKASAMKSPAAKPPEGKSAPATKPKPPPPARRADARMAAATPDGGWVTYDDHVQEIFMTNCSACHDADTKESGLDLTSFATARAGGSSGTTIVPGDIDQSRLYQLVAHLQKPTMPPDEPAIDRKHIDLIRRWIEQGAPENEAGAAAAARKKSAARPTPEALAPRFDGPAPMPAGWPAVAPATTVRAVGVKSLAASGRGPLLAIPGQGQVFVQHSDTGEPIGILPFPHGEVEVLAFSADCSRLLAAGGTPGKRGRAVLYNVSDGKVIGTFGRQFDAVLAAAVHPQLTHVALGGPSRRVRVFDTRTGTLAYEIKGHDEWVLAVDFSSDGKLLVSADRAGVIILSEAATGRDVEVIRRHRGAVHAVRFAPDGQSFASAGADATLRRFAVKGARQITQRGAGAPALALAFSPDGKLLAVGGDDGRTRIYRSDGAPLFTLPPVGDWVYAVAFDHESRTVFAGDFQGATSAFDLKSRKRTGRWTPTAPGVTNL